MTPLFMTWGSYARVAITEPPDDATVANILLPRAQSANVRTTTLKAFTEAEYRRIIGSLD